jgi:hypothetical protein
MSLARPAWRLLPRNVLPTTSRNAYRTPFRLQSHPQHQLPQAPTLASFRTFSATTRRFQGNQGNQHVLDGLRNNRDISSSGASAAADVSQSDAKLLSDLAAASTPRPDVPSYQMVFTCKKCDERSAHTISKQGYHHGTVLVTCPECKSRHLMSDNLKV